MEEKQGLGSPGPPLQSAGLWLTPTPDLPPVCTSLSSQAPSPASEAAGLDWLLGQVPAAWCSSQGASLQVRPETA